MFSKWDLSQAYAQLELDLDSKKIAVINTQEGLVRYNRLPYACAETTGDGLRLYNDLPRDIEEKTAVRAFI